jgi:N-sulfoglucosamine sulfohydrolase
MKAILAALFLSATLAGGGAAAQPNIVVFLSDDHSLLDSTAYGSKDVKTPAMERLANAGMTFDRAFVASPSCAPSRAALLTGLMPVRNGAEANHSKPRPEIKKLPAYLKALGYEVVSFGKVSHYRHTGDYGFDHFAHDTFHDDVAIPNGIKWLRERKSGKPLCIFFGTNWPHVPWPETSEGYDPEKLSVRASHVDTPRTRDMRARYYAAVSRMDKELGDVFDAAKDVLGPNTFFLFSADHGAQWPFGKWTLYDAGIRTPLIVVWPEKIEAGARTDAMVSWIDILPTLVEVGGGAAPQDIDGTSFLGVLRGQTREHRDRIFTTHSGDPPMNVYPMRSVRTGDWKYIRNLHPEFSFTTHIDLGQAADGAGYFASWREKAKTDEAAAALVKRYHERPAEELYDLRADPLELRNLAGDPQHAQRLAAMRADVEAWMKANNDEGKIYGEPRLSSDPDRAKPPPAAKKRPGSP